MSAKLFEEKRNSTSVYAKKDTGPKAMPAAGKTWIFPREDNMFKKK